MPKYAHDITDLLSPEDIRKLYDAAKSPREQVLVCFLALTGLRPGELLAVQKKDITLEQDQSGAEFVHFILPTEKTNADGTKFVLKTRHLKMERPSGVQMNVYLETILVYVGHLAHPNDRLLDYTRRWAEKRINRLGMEVLGKQISPYHFRHSGCTNQFAQGRTPDQVMHYKGAKSLRSVLPYAHASPYNLTPLSAGAPRVCKTCGQAAAVLFSNGECEACKEKSIRATLPGGSS